ncbi:hypothetical protein AMECASPLE_031071 [Ameca splendens]|uniref:Uncharacterized protein n=1 Tax=Ameca splendens TaxID=208324 RepID=A0ABV0YH92_9TELE
MWFCGWTNVQRRTLEARGLQVSSVKTKQNNPARAGRGGLGKRARVQADDLEAVPRRPRVQVVCNNGACNLQAGDAGAGVLEAGSEGADDLQAGSEGPDDLKAGDAGAGDPEAGGGTRRIHDRP